MNQIGKELGKAPPVNVEWEFTMPNSRSVFAVVASISALAGCHKTDIPVYPYRGIELLAEVRGVLRYDGSCFSIVTDIETLAPVWPEGTRVVPGGVRLPDRNGGTLLTTGQSVVVRGGKIDHEAARGFGMQARCEGAAFLVNSVRE